MGMVDRWPLDADEIDHVTDREVQPNLHESAYTKFSCLRVYYKYIPNQKLACLVLYVKIINTFLEKW